MEDGRTGPPPGSGLAPGAAAGGIDVAGVLAELEAAGIAGCVLQSFGAHNLAAAAERAGLARRTNEFFADTVEQASGHIAAVAAVPMGDTGAAAEVAHALDVLKLDGVCLPTSHDGTYLGDPSFDDLLTVLDERHAVVLVHPVPPLGAHQRHLDFPFLHLEMPFDTTRALANMLVNRTIERFPDIKFVMPHAGGTFPYLAFRLSAGLLAAEERAGVRTMADAATRVTDALNHLHFDIAMAAADPSLAVLRDHADPTRILFGTDCPPGPAPLQAATAAAVARFTWDVALNDNARTLFPRFVAG